MAGFVPELEDVYLTRAILHRQLGLPSELVHAILEEARYWIEEGDEMYDDHDVHDPGAHIFASSRPGHSAAVDVLITPAFLVPRVSVRSPKLQIREIEFTIFEVSIIRPNPTPDLLVDSYFADHLDSGVIFDSIYDWRNYQLTDIDFDFVRRPSADMEPQRLHCKEMMEVSCPEKKNKQKKGNSPTKVQEGEHAWYLQGNHIGKEFSAYEGEMVPRYRVVWGSKANPLWSGNEGAGRGTGFVDMLKPGDWICVWARAKRSGWENHVYGVRINIKYMVY
ncbi:hypothetical protein IQ07DRAFT_643380 [Pyrenochaeta sp. DS3sAY3a]|nr:hypothetical protein IQ07DRAFT_643380 [Pyrenochaeta sp. DS3sAY3a]